MTYKKIPVSLKLNSDLFDAIERKRGDTGRGPFIENVLKKYFFEEEAPKRDTEEYKKLLERLEGENIFLRERIERMETLILQLQAKIPMAAIEKPKRKGFWSIFKRRQKED
jgi:hypothetical protein